MKSGLVHFQLGKNPIDENFIESLGKTFKNHDLVKLSVLKSQTRDRQEIKKIALELCSELRKREKKDFTAKIVGFTIFIKKWRRKLV